MRRLHRAWAVCLGCTLMLLVSGGLCINAFSVTQPYILAQNGFTNTETSMITTACSVTFLHDAGGAAGRRASSAFSSATPSAGLPFRSCPAWWQISRAATRLRT